MAISDLLRELQELPSARLLPASPNAASKLERSPGAPLPSDYRELLGLCSGVEGPAMEIDFTGEALDFGFEEAFPTKVTFCHDRSGNFWLVDLGEPSTDSPIFFASHNPPVVLFQCMGIETFLRELIKSGRYQESSLEEVHEDRPFRVWTTNPGVLSWEQASGKDAEMADFAKTLDSRYSFIDLREPKVGMGFSWGRFGPQTEVQRHPSRRIFAVAPPVKEPGLFARLFGR